MQYMTQLEILVPLPPACSPATAMEAPASSPAADPRDENVTSYINELMDWDGSQAKNINTPITQIIGYVFTAFFLSMALYVVWAQLRDLLKRHRQGRVPYKVLKPPSTVIEASKDTKGKRVCAVLGGTGFIGSHVVDELVNRGRHFVYLLGRNFDKGWDNPSVDACIQVDLLDFDGLVNALGGVDTVIVTAAVIPNAYTPVDDVWRGNKLGLENALLAAEKAGVKAFVFLCGMEIEDLPKEPQSLAFYKALLATQNAVIEANGKGGMRTCVVAPSQVYGLRSSLYEPLLARKFTSLPMPGQNVSFVPVDYVVRALLSAEEKLIAGDGRVAGKVFPLAGKPSTFKEFFALPAWGFKISPMPMWIMSAMARLNVFCGQRLKFAPLGPDMSPGVVSFMTMAEKKVDCKESWEVLEIGAPPTPEEGVKRMVASYKARAEKEKSE